jgi:hypothetical protein
MNIRGETRRETLGSVVILYGTRGHSPGDARMCVPSCEVFAQYTDPISGGVIEVVGQWHPDEAWGLDKTVNIILGRCKAFATRTNMALDDLARLRAMER